MKENARKKFGAELKKLRVKKRIPTTFLQHSGMSNSVYANIENGGNYLIGSLENYLQLCEIEIEMLNFKTGEFTI